MDYSEKIFEMLKIEPEEEFRIEVPNLTNVREKYKLTAELTVMGLASLGTWEKSRFDISRFINGEIKIKKIQYSEQCLHFFNKMPFKIGEYAFYIENEKIVKSKIVGVAIDTENIWIEFELKGRIYERVAISVDGCYKTEKAAELALKECENNG